MAAAATFKSTTTVNSHLVLFRKHDFEDKKTCSYTYRIFSAGVYYVGSFCKMSQNWGMNVQPRISNYWSNQLLFLLG